MKKKIVSIHFGGNVGGAPISMLQMLAVLNKHGYTTLAIFTESGPILKFAKTLNVSTKVVPMRSVFSYGAYVPLSIKSLYNFFTYYYQTVRASRKIIKKIKPDIVHINTSVLIPTAIGVKKLGVPILWHIREAPGPNKFIRNWHIGMIKKLSNAIIVTSNYVKEYYKNGFNVKTVHNAVDLLRFKIDSKEARRRIRSEFNISEKSPLICMIGSIQKAKGHFLLVESAKKIIENNQNVKFLIIAGGVGKGYQKSWKGKIKNFLGIPFDNLEKMKNMILDLNLDNNFIFTGYREDIPELLAASDIVTFLSQDAEGFGRPIIEGMAMKKPVVATDIGPSKEILNQESGILIPVGKVNPLIDALNKLISNPQLCRDMGQKGNQIVEKKFALDKQILKIKKHIDALL